MTTALITVAAGGLLAGCSATVAMSSQDTEASPHGNYDRAQHAETVHWSEAESAALTNHVQLTFPDRFVKAGEAYFSPDDSRIIFQAIEVPAEGQEPDEVYAMFVADLDRDSRGRITGLGDIRRISPIGSANTCGWFHPLDPNTVIFATTLTTPGASNPPGYNRSSGRYRWMFPPEMHVVQCDLREADGTADPLQPVVDGRGAYVAEASLTTDARHLLFCSLESGDGDLFAMDLANGDLNRLVAAAGYDGGPFFSPDDKRICYRSDRRGNHLLQLFVSDLAFNEDGTIVGIEREYQLTDDEAVNWCPYWHPNGRYLVFSTSRLGHHNYEIFLIDADPGDLPGSTGTIRYGAGVKRVTHFPGSDVLPVFNADGSLMMWTSRRGEAGTVQLWVADFVMDLGGS